MLDLGDLMVHESGGGTVQGPTLLLASEQKIYSFDLWDTFRIAIGRHQANDIPLISQKVSNYHAEILNEGESLFLNDLRSTNGTFLNEQKVRKVLLNNGDRIRVGSHELVVQIKNPTKLNAFSSCGGNSSLPIGARGQLLSSKGRSEESHPRPPSAEKSDASLVQLLMAFAGTERSVKLQLKSRRGERGEVFIKEGRLIHAEFGNVRGEKSLFRMLTWRDAAYEIQQFPASLNHRSIELPMDTLITEGLEQVDGLALLSAKLPPGNATLRSRPTIISHAID